jgi:Flp pilus assembly secretin CpaC
MKVISNRFIWFFWGAYLVLPPALRSETDNLVNERPPLILNQGEQKMLKVPGLQKYSLGSPVIRAIPLPFKSPTRTQEILLIKAVSVGTGDVWIWKQDGTSEHQTVYVEKVSHQDLNPLLKHSLLKLEEVEVIQAGKGVVLRGVVNSLCECSKIAALTRNFPKEIQDETQISVQLLQNSQKKLEAWLKSSPSWKNLRLEKVSDTLWLRGQLETSSEKSTVEKEARALFPLIRTEIESFPSSSSTVYFRVFLFELKKKEFHQFGLTWPGTVEKSFKVTSRGIQDILEIDLALQQLEGNGGAKILSSPQLVVRAPGEAELFTGGELPIQNKSRYTSNLSWRKFGLTLKLKVTHLVGDRVWLEISTEVSHLDSSLSQNDIPGIQSNRMQTQVDAKFGAPLFLSGLLQHGTREDTQGIPFLRKIPLFGTLFGSENSLSQSSELVAILYPHSHPPAANLQHPSGFIPKPIGNVPMPRHVLTTEEELELRQSPLFPWNALE